MRFIKVTRSDLPGGYIQPADEVAEAIDGEFDWIEDMQPGTTFHLQVVEMDPAEVEKLEEFQGW